MKQSPRVLRERSVASALCCRLLSYLWPEQTLREERRALRRGEERTTWDLRAVIGFVTRRFDSIRQERVNGEAKRRLSSSSRRERVSGTRDAHSRDTRGTHAAATAAAHTPQSLNRFGDSGGVEAGLVARGQRATRASRALAHRTADTHASYWNERVTMRPEVSRGPLGGRRVCTRTVCVRASGWYQ